MSAFRRTSPLGFPFAGIAVLSGIGILAPPALVILAAAGCVLAVRHMHKASPAKPKTVPPLSPADVQNLLRTQFRAQPQMREQARRAEIRRQALLAPAPRSEPPRRPRTHRRTSGFAGAAALLLLFIGVPAALAGGTGLAAALLAACCVFFLLADPVQRSPAPARKPALSDLLDRALGDDGQEMAPVTGAGMQSAREPMGAAAVSGQQSRRPGAPFERRLHLFLPEDDAFPDGEADAPPAPCGERTGEGIA